MYTTKWCRFGFVLELLMFRSQYGEVTKEKKRQELGKNVRRKVK